MTQDKDILAEFPRPVAVYRLGAENTFEIAASSEECRALAARFGVEAISGLAARITLTKLESGRRIRLEGRFSTDVVQSCVVTLDPLASHLDDSFSLIFDADANPEREILVSLDGDDPPEPLVDGIIDMGEAVAEHLGLALEAYPWAPKADHGAIAAVSASGGGEIVEKSPFSMLAGMKSKS